MLFICYNYFSVIFRIQDFLLIVALTILLFNFFATYTFQAGLIQLLYVRFRATLILCVAYVILSISLHIWHMTIHWHQPLTHYWTRGFHCLYSIHRTGKEKYFNYLNCWTKRCKLINFFFFLFCTVAIMYYYFYKRASLRIGDPRFYEGSSWIEKQLSLT